MKLLFDFFPVILFFVAFELSDIFVATAVAIVASLSLIGWTLVRRRKISKMQWATCAIIVVFGGATLILHDETFIKWKPTVLYWLGAVMIVGGLAFKTNFVKSLMQDAGEFELPESLWTRLAFAWGLFLVVVGALNLWIAFNFATPVWVKFKTFGAAGLMFVFVFAQAWWILRHMPEEPAKPGSPES